MHKLCAFLTWKVLTLPFIVQGRHCPRTIEEEWWNSADVPWIHPWSCQPFSALRCAFACPRSKCLTWKHSDENDWVEPKPQSYFHVRLYIRERSSEWLQCPSVLGLQCGCLASISKPKTLKMRRESQAEVIVLCKDKQWKRAVSLGVRLLCGAVSWISPVKKISLENIEKYPWVFICCGRGFGWSDTASSLLLQSQHSVLCFAIECEQFSKKWRLCTFLTK